MGSYLLTTRGDSHVDRRILLAIIVGLVLGVLPLLFLRAESAAATVRPGFEDRLVASTDDRPMALAFTPNGRMLIALKRGQVRVYDDGQLLQTPALDLASGMCRGRESGLLGIALDPDFGVPGHNYVYLFYTHKKNNACPTDWNPGGANLPGNRVSRFVMSDNTINRSSEEVLIDNIPNPTGNHNAGDLAFGKDGHLYVTVGDGQCDYAQDSGCQARNDATRDQNVLLGKVLRITRSGGIPASNPYTGTDSARCNLTGQTDPGKKCQETFAWGLRNPFRFAFDPDASGTRFFIGDVGNEEWDEIDLGEAGADYAWNFCEGNHDNKSRPGSVDCSAAPYTPPIYEYSHDAGCSAIVGAAFVPDGVWPAEYDDSYLYSDVVCNKILELKPESGGSFTQREFASDLGQAGPVAMAFGPHGSGQALYYTTAFNGGEVRRIAYTGAVNRPPTAAVTADPTAGPAPLDVDFDGSGSTDPDPGDTLRYHWNFGDDDTAETTSPTISHTYSTEGTYTASLRVEDDRGALSDPDTVRIDAGNEAPTPTIQSPSAGLRYGVGEEITLRGSATDPEDGDLPPTSLEWEVLKHHNDDHTHPVLAETGNETTFTAPPPEGISATGPGNFLEVRLTATDSAGLSTTVIRNVQPNRVDVSFATVPRGLSLQAEDLTFAAPETLVSWEGYELNVSASSPQNLSGKTYVFDSWSDGNSRRHSIVTGATPRTYTATFKACTKKGTAAGETLTGTPQGDVICGGGGNDTVVGKAGNDMLHGGDGADTVRGDSGADKLYGEDGPDGLNSRDGVSGNDSLDGGAGTDTRTTDATERSIVGFP